MSEHLRPGELNRYVSVQQRDTTRDALGGQDVTWTEIKNVYAKIEALSGREFLTAQAAQSEVTHRITVRYDAIFALPRTVATYRIVYASRNFNITASMNIEERNSIIELLAQEGVNDG